MALSSDLISQFVKATKDEKETVTETTAYGKIVVKEDGKEYVQLDGSELLTPISTTTVVDDGDRVMVTIKNHTAIVTGDLTNPSASNKDVTEIGNKISEFEIIIADKVTTEQLEAEIARIEQLRTEELEATNAKIETLEGKVAKIDKIETDIIDVSGKVTANEAEIDTLRADIADFKDVTADRVDAVEGEFNTLKSDYATFESTVTTKLEAAEADIKDLDAEKLDAETAKVTYATIDFANINEAAVEKLFSDSGIIKDLIMSDGKVTGELVGVTIKGDIIEGNTVKADKLVILGEDGLYYKLNIDALGEAAASSDEKYQNGLDGSAILAESITAEKIAVDDLVAFGATIGGFHINEDAIYSGVKNSMTNATPGIHLSDDGQVNIGDQNNFFKYYIDENGQYKLEIQADTLRFGSSNTTIEEYIENAKEPISLVTDKDTELVIDDGVKIIEFSVDGKSTQETRSGINQLMSFEDGETSYFSSLANNKNSDTDYWKTVPLADNWVHAECDLTGRTTTNNSYLNFFISLNKLPNLKTSTTYTIVIEFRNVNITKMQSNLYLGQTHGTADAVFTSAVTLSQSPISKGETLKYTISTYSTFSSSSLIALRNFQTIIPGDKFSYDIRVSILEGDYTNTDYVYEPFGVSPSPDYPSEIVSVGYENLYKGPDSCANNGITFTKNSDGTYNINGTSTAQANAYSWISIEDSKLIDGETYIVHVNQDLPTGVYVLVEQYNGSTWQRSLIDNLNIAKQIDLTDTTQIRFGIRVNSGYTIDTHNIAIMLERGSAKHSYIPYGKTGVEVIHQSRNYFPNTDKYAEYGVWTGALDDTNSLNGYPSVITVSAWAGPYLNLKKIIANTNLKVGDTVTYSIYFKTNFTPTRNMGFTLYRATSSNSGSLVVPMADVTPGKWIRIKMTFTLNEYSLTAERARLEADYYDTSDPYYFGNNRENKIYFACPQLEKGSVMTDWVANFSNSTVFALDEPLRSLPNGVKDIAYVDHGKLYVDRYVGSKILDGSEEWGFSYFSSNGYVYTTISDRKLDNPIVLCDRFTRSTSIKADTNTSYTSTYNKAFCVFPSDDIATTNAEWLAWLAENNMKVIYELATPVTDYIGEVSIPMYKDKTNVYYVNDGLTPYIQCEYYTLYAERVADLDQLYNDETNALEQQIIEQKAEILVEAGAIVQTATKELVTQTDFGNYKESVSTTMKTTAEGVFIDLNKTNEGRLDTLEDSTTDINKKLSKYFSFTDDGLTIGSGDAAMKLRLDNEDGIIFEKANGDRVGYWDGTNFYTGNIIVRVEERAQFGNYAYLPKVDGSLVFTRVK